MKHSWIAPEQYKRNECHIAFIQLYSLAELQRDWHEAGHGEDLDDELLRGSLEQQLEESSKTIRVCSYEVH